MGSNKDSDYTCTLSPDVQKKAKKELKEDPGTRMIEVKTLRDRLEKVSGLHSRKDTFHLLQFLRARKFDQEKAFQLIKSSYAARRDYPDFYDDLKPSRVRQMVETGIFEVLDHRDKNGCKVVAMRVDCWDSDRHSCMVYIQTINLILAKLLEEEETQVNGVHILINLDKMTLKHCSAVTPACAVMFMRVLQDSLPMRLKCVHYVNEPSIFEVVFAMIKSFAKEKIVQRIKFVGQKTEKLHKEIDPAHLPTDFGGKLPRNSNKAWMDAFFASDAEFESNNKFGFINMGVTKSDGVSRSGDAGMQGLGGTFKKLEI